ncbi:TetR family transcriptional regulator C-terminal domain-containing protein [Arcticibacter eurypsychrophilus]|uniref:TetR family transcriptional regulator C-terminal domain-containing protein n=1 Tax=Arcticibacter eurypsychrophilus TaxID=1434752 RepID=UPI00084CF99A|nr:TetR family transcriptional regulator C-terminal domain-containing protein [Arcticibacter eurypsychrophilus]
METKEKLQEAYIKYVLTNGEQPKTVFIFAKENDMPEEEFYNHFTSFESMEISIWAGLMNTTVAEVKAQEVWGQYTSREKALSLFYSFIELLKGKRSFAIFSLKKAPGSIGNKKLLQGLKSKFEVFSAEIIQEGIESGELMDRPFFANKYKDALWIQFGFVLNFWLKDTSPGFDKTDQAIEKGVNVTYNLFQRSPLDELLDYGKFLAKNTNVKMPF